jgi:[ribosomal protein S18]-alanine N-acetyltransferase
LGSLPFKKSEKTLDLKTPVYNLTVLDALLLFAGAIVFLGQSMVFAFRPLPESLLNAAVELDHLVLADFWSLASYRQELARPSSDLLGLWLTPLQDPSLLAVGCAWTILDEAHIILMAVHPDYRRRGFGAGMLLSLLERAHNRAMKYATLEVRVSNEAAIALYTKLGFTSVGKRPNYYADNGEDALVLWRSGLQSPEFKHQIDFYWNVLKQRWG